MLTFPMRCLSEHSFFHFMTLKLSVLTKHTTTLLLCGIVIILSDITVDKTLATVQRKDFPSTLTCHRPSPWM
jgi:hypothetical protein